MTMHARMNWKTIGLGVVLMLCSVFALAQPLAPITPPPGVQLTQRLDAQLPLALRLADSEGRSLQLADVFGRDRPVVVLLGYYQCPQLCGLVMHGLLEALEQSGLARSDYSILRMSIDPDDTPHSAHVRRDADLAYAAFLRDGRTAAPLDLRVLTGDAAAIAQFAQAAGVRFVASHDPDAPADARFAHPATVIVATPQGRIAQYLMGVQFDAAEVRLALVAAAGGRIGTLSDRIALLCAHLDPKFGLHTNAVLWTLRALGVALVVLLAALWWRQRTTTTPQRGLRA